MKLEKGPREDHLRRWFYNVSFSFSNNIRCKIWLNIERITDQVYSDVFGNLLNYTNIPVPTEIGTLLYEFSFINVENKKLPEAKI